VKDTITELRQRFWITKGRSFVRKLLFNCQTCRRHNAKNYDYPKSPPRTALRTQDARVFTSFINNYEKNVYSRKSITYTLYVCASSRAFILDLITHPSAPEFNASSLTWFISRRGCPDPVITTNGTIFTAKDTKKFTTNITLAISTSHSPPRMGDSSRVTSKSSSHCSIKSLGPQSTSSKYKHSISKSNRLWTAVQSLVDLSCDQQNRPSNYQHPQTHHLSVNSIQRLIGFGKGGELSILPNWENDNVMKTKNSLSSQTSIMLSSFTKIMCHARFGA